MINWKLRVRNKATLTSLAGILVAAAYQILAVLGIAAPVGQEAVTEVIGLILTALAAFGVIVDPTTAGAFDSARAMEYEKPRED